MSSAYASPWAGASILTVANYDDYRLQGNQLKKVFIFIMMQVLIFKTEMDAFTQKEFKRLADEVPEAHVQYVNGIQYCEKPAPEGEDVYWVRKIYNNVSNNIHYKRRNLNFSY